MEDCKVSSSPSSSKDDNEKTAVKKQRKPRTVKNAYVDIDSVDVEPGENYCEWIEITKQKLKEREQKQTEIAIRQIESIVNEHTPPQITFVFPPELTNRTLRALFHKINRWNGVTASRLKSPITRYRDYFKVAKSWYIQMKRKAYGDLFWAQVFLHIKKLLCSKTTELCVVDALFSGTVDYSNTKPVNLINGGTIIHSDGLHQYLFTLHDSLRIKQWIKEQEMCGNWHKKAEAICIQIQSQLQVLMEWKPIKKEAIVPPPDPIKVLGLPPYPIPVPPNGAYVNNGNTVKYSALRSQSRHVADVRPSPLSAANDYTKMLKSELDANK